MRHPSSERKGSRWKWAGIRFQLLVLLLPGIALMLMIDSWSDHRDRIASLERAYDETLLEPLAALDDSVHFNSSGLIDLVVPFAVQAMFEAIPGRQKHLHVGVTLLNAANEADGPERTLMGPGDLPLPPALPASQSRSPLADPSVGGDERYAGHPVFYTATYRNSPLRIAALQRNLQDALGRRYRLNVQAAESMERWVEVRQASLDHEVRQYMRILSVTALLVWFGIVWTLVPLKRLRQSLLGRAPHDLRPLDTADIPYEVVPLVDAVNHHIENYQKLLSEQSSFLADASHQLRTPLAIMMAQAGYALRESDPGRMREALQAITTQLRRSERLSSQLLSMAHAARVEGDAPPNQLVDLGALAREVVLQYLPLARQKEQDLGWTDVQAVQTSLRTGEGNTGSMLVPAQSAEIYEALANLVHNAIRYTPVGGRITVGLYFENGCAGVEVSDDGPGIPSDQREAVFQRFGRGVKSNPHESGGSAGLGLAIARAYARRNGGEIVLAQSASGESGAGGLAARLVFPSVGRHKD